MVGLQALMKVSGCLDKSRLTTGQVGFGLAPRINAAGRLERAMRAVEMLTTDDPALAGSIAEELDLVNSRRQEIEREILREAQEMIRAEGGLKDRGAIVLGRKGWHPGVIGIVASRLVDFYHRPTVVVAFGDEFAQGSARSVPGFNLYEAIRDCSEGLIAYGGHAAAAGLKLTESHFPTFAQRFDERCRTTLTAEQLQKALIIDAEVMLSMLTLPVLEEIGKLEPHGIGNPRPLLLASQVRVVGEPRLVGEQKNHVQLRLVQGNTQLKAIAWNMAEKAKELKPNMSCSIVFHPSINEWNGRRDVQLELRDLVVEPEAPAPASAASPQAQERWVAGASKTPPQLNLSPVFRCAGRSPPRQEIAPCFVTASASPFSCSCSCSLSRFLAPPWRRPRPSNGSAPRRPGRPRSWKRSSPESSSLAAKRCSW